MATHREIVYTRVPEGRPDAGCFRLVEALLPRPADGQVLARTHFLSIDPYMRRRMGGGHGQYAKPLQPGDVMIGRGAGLVVDSRHPEFRSGERVQGEFGWREHAVLDGRPVDGLVPGRPAQIQRDGRSGLGGPRWRSSTCCRAAISASRWCA